MKKIENKKSILTKHQQEIFDDITKLMDEKLSSFLKSDSVESYFVSLVGAAGTGKTFLTTQIAKYLLEKQETLGYPNNLDYQFTITAPTHKAVGVIADILYQNNIQASCKTIHSFLGIKPFIDLETGEEKFAIDKTKKDREVTSILIVDESSMVGSELYNHIADALKGGRVNLVLFVGDPNQLLPVNDSKNPVYALDQRFELTEVVRQAEESYIIQVATRLRKRIESKEFIDLGRFFAECASDYDEITFFHNKNDFLEDFYKDEKWYEQSKIVATYKNQNVDAFNRAIRARYWEERGVHQPATLLKGDRLRFKEAYSVGDVTLYHNGQEIMLEKAELCYHDALSIEYWECKSTDAPGQQIFRVVDPQSLKVFNDKLSIIAKKAKSAMYPANKKLWEAFFATRNMFAEVQYVHASTIHKLQGSTYEVTYIDLFSLAHNSYMSMDEKYRLAYVAVTRASSDIKVFMSAFGSSAPHNGTLEVDVAEKFKNTDVMLEKLGI